MAVAFDPARALPRRAALNGRREIRSAASPPPGRHRLFFALMPDEALREAMARIAADLEATQPGAGRRIRPERYHMTLRFLGGFDSLAAGLLDTFRAAAGTLPLEPFTFHLDRAGSFRNRSIPWWLGCADVPPPLAALQGALERSLGASMLPLAPAPAFVPHVTVVRDARRPLPSLAIGPLEWNATELVLVHSDAAAGHAYARLGSWALKPAME